MFSTSFPMRRTLPSRNRPTPNGCADIAHGCFAQKALCSRSVLRTFAALQHSGSSWKRCTVPYGCKLEDLVAILHDSDPAKTEAIVLQRRRVDYGLLSVGLKIHCLGMGRQFLSLAERLGGASKALEMNKYRHSQASLCLVLPPVGNARAAILLLECIERFTGSALFGDRKIQIQVCSLGRLNSRRSALLAIGFYLGSDTLRRYACGGLETTVSHDRRHQRGQRPIIYDAGGEFDREFEWWEGSRNGKLSYPAAPTAVQKRSQRSARR